MTVKNLSSFDGIVDAISNNLGKILTVITIAMVFKGFGNIAAMFGFKVEDTPEEKAKRLEKVEEDIDDGAWDENFLANGPKVTPDLIHQHAEEIQNHLGLPFSIFEPSSWQENGEGAVSVLMFHTPSSYSVLNQYWKDSKFDGDNYLTDTLKRLLSGSERKEVLHLFQFIIFMYFMWFVIVLRISKLASFIPIAKNISNIHEIALNPKSHF